MTGRRKWRSLTTMTIVVVAILILAAVITPLLFWQYRTLDIREEREIDSYTGAERLLLNLTATVGELRVVFTDAPGMSARIVAEVKGRSGFFSDESPLRLQIKESSDTARGGKNVTASVSFDTYAPWPHYSLSETHYTVEVNRSLRCSLNLTVTTGGVTLATADGTVLEGLRLNATSKGAAISLNNGTVLAGDMKIKTATGGTVLRWNNVTVDGDRTMTISESSGRIDARFDQVEPLGGRLLVISKATAGETRVVLDLKGDTSAHVLVNEGIGGAEIINRGGFVGTEVSFRSANYPSLESFSVQVNNTIGTIIVDGRWTAA